MTALLRIVPDIADHGAGAAQAHDQLASFRKTDLKLVAPLPCHRCGKTECDEGSAWIAYDALLQADAPEDDLEAAFERWVLAQRACVPKVPLSLVQIISAADIELDARGYCALDNWDHAIDVARDRR